MGLAEKFRIFILVIFLFASLIVFLMLQILIIDLLTSDKMYVTKDYVDGENAINLEGFKCEKTVLCNGFFSILESKDCEDAYAKSKLDWGTLK